MAQTSHRPRLIPKTTIVAAAVIVVLLAGAGLSAYLVSRSQLVNVPDVRGLPSDTAKARLRDVGLGYEITSTHVSVDVGAGRVIEQSPDAGGKAAPGTVIAVVVSAGPQSFVVPDLVGDPLASARDVLSDMGFTVVVETVTSETTETIVLEMYPAPGTSANVGDEIRLTVPGDPGVSEALLPYDLTGLTVLLDPAAAPAELAVDAPMEVARRLQSLLEAAGATVNTTRLPSGAAATPAERVAAAQGSSADLLIGIGVTQSGAGGITVFYEDGEKSTSPSVAYARSITRAATLPTLSVSEPRPIKDAVLEAFAGTRVRVAVGDATAPSDLARFGDPTWADQVARAVYRGIGTVQAAE